MPVVVTVRVTNPQSLLDDGFDYLKVYRSNYEDGYFLEISDISTRIPLSLTQKYYNFEDASSEGTSSSWYKTSYYDSISTDESVLSAASRGIEIEPQSYEESYESEINMTSSDEYNVDKIRQYIGDSRLVTRDYVSSSCTSGYSNVSEDGYTYKLSEEKGWPTRVIKDSVEYTTKDDPIVSGYSLLTFSGSTISTISGTVDIWYNSFRHSDREILKVFNTTPSPPYVPTSSATPEMIRLSASISIILQEITKLMGETSGSFNLQGELSYNPQPLLKEKRALLNDLQKKLDDLAGEVVSNNITGVRVD